MINVIEEVEEPQENALPFEIPGIDTTSEEISKPEETVEEKIPENPVKETEETVEEKIPEKTEKKEKKKTDKQVSLFSF